MSERGENQEKNAPMEIYCGEEGCAKVVQGKDKGSGAKGKATGTRDGTPVLRQHTSTRGSVIVSARACRC